MGTKAEGVDALLVPAAHRSGCDGFPTKPKVKPSDREAVTALSSRREPACALDSARERVSWRPYPGRSWACSASEVASSPSIHTRGRPRCRFGNRQGRLRSYHRVKGVSFARYHSTHCEGAGSAVPGSRRSDPYRTHDGMLQPPE
jgi:hypothetical protein